jgi:hypothetical protein
MGSSFRRSKISNVPLTRPRARFAALILLSVIAAGAGVDALADSDAPGGGTSSGPAATGAERQRPPAPLGRPPGPIPGYLLIADRGNDRLLLVDARKRILWRYPRSGQRPSMPFSFDDDAFFGLHFRRIISNQEEQHTIEVISFPGGRLVWHYGKPNVSGSAPGLLNTPDDAYLLPDGTRIVADIQNCRILFLSPGGRVVRQLGQTGVCVHDPPHSFAAPNGDTPLRDGGVLVTEINGSWIDRIGPDGSLRWSVHAPIAYPSDAQPLPGGRILVADYSGPGHVLIMDRSGKVLWHYGPASGPGELDHPSLALLLPNGLIAVNDDYRQRVVLIDRSSDRIVWQYGHEDMPGSARGYLDNPDGMDFLPAWAARRPAISRLLRSRASGSRGTR